MIARGIVRWRGGTLAGGLLVGYLLVHIWQTYPLIQIGPISILYLVGVLALLVGVLLGLYNVAPRVAFSFYAALSAGFLFQFLVVSLFRRLTLYPKLFVSLWVGALLILGVASLTFTVGQLLRPVFHDEAPRMNRRQLIEVSVGGTAVALVSLGAISQMQLAVAV